MVKQGQVAETKEQLRRAERLEARRLSWDNYTKCDPLPDAGSEKALNTYLSQGADEEVHRDGGGKEGGGEGVFSCYREKRKFSLVSPRLPTQLSYCINLFLCGRRG